MFESVNITPSKRTTEQDEMTTHKFKTQKDAESYAKFIGEGMAVYSLEHHSWIVAM